MLLAETNPRPIPFYLAFLLLWLTVLIATPIGLWVIGESSLPYTVTLGVLANVALAISALAFRWSARRIAITVISVIGFTWLAEFIGSQRGFPFGAYHYTDILQPQIGHVPLIIPLAWLMLLPSAWAVSEAYLAPYPKLQHPLIMAILSGAAFTAWDLYLDPQMVAKNLWLWDQAGGYFGIPWQNYLGWWGVSSLLTLILRPHNLPHRPLLLIYALTWLFQAVGLGLFWGQPWPALVGFIAMGAFICPLLWREFYKS